MHQNIQHGTVSGYATHRCRCKKCKHARYVYYFENLTGMKLETVQSLRETMSIDELALHIGVKRYSVARLLNDDVIPHGTATGYSYHGCRCNKCKHANNERHLKQIKKDRELEHGTANTYQNYGCRCELCTQAASEYNRQRYKYQKRKDKITPRQDKKVEDMNKREQILRLLQGHSQSRVADMTGVSRQYVSYVNKHREDHERDKREHADFVQKVKDAFARCGTLKGAAIDLGVTVSKVQRIIGTRNRQRGFVHGTVNGYVNYQCRCDYCKGAHTEYIRNRRARLKGISL